MMATAESKVLRDPKDFRRSIFTAILAVLEFLKEDNLAAFIRASAVTAEHNDDFSYLVLKYLGDPIPPATGYWKLKWPEIQLIQETMKTVHAEVPPEGSKLREFFEHAAAVYPPSLERKDMPEAGDWLDFGELVNGLLVVEVGKVYTDGDEVVKVDKVEEGKVYFHATDAPVLAFNGSIAKFLGEFRLMDPQP